MRFKVIVIPGKDTTLLAKLTIGTYRPLTIGKLYAITTKGQKTTPGGTLDTTHRGIVAAQNEYTNSQYLSKLVALLITGQFDDQSIASCCQFNPNAPGTKSLLYILASQDIIAPTLRLIRSTVTAVWEINPHYENVCNRLWGIKVATLPPNPIFFIVEFTHNSSPQDFWNTITLIKDLPHSLRVLGFKPNS